MGRSFGDSTRRSVEQNDYVFNYYTKRTHSLRSRDKSYVDIMYSIISMGKSVLLWHLYLSKQAWKGMLDGGCFIRAGWVHELKIYCYTAEEEQRFVVMGKVRLWLE